MTKHLCLPARAPIYAFYSVQLLIEYLYLQSVPVRTINYVVALGLPCFPFTFLFLLSKRKKKVKASYFNSLGYLKENKKLFVFIIVVQVQLSPFSPHHFPPPTHPHFPPSNLPTLALSMCPLYISLMDLALFYPIIPHTSPLWFLSVFPLFPCLWFYFAHLFVLLIRFHL